MKKRPCVCVVFALLFFSFQAGAQDFGFGAEAGDSGESGSPGFTGGDVPAFPVKLGGEVKAELNAFFNDLDSASSAGNIKPGNIFSGRLNVSYSGSAADAVIKLKLETRETPETLSGGAFFLIDEAYLRGYFGPVQLEAGLRKLTWGKADSMGPLDLINPLDFSDLSKLNNLEAIKIARPMLHIVWNTGPFSKLEGVFVPWFEGQRFASEGRWTPVEWMLLMEKAKQFSVTPPDPDTTKLHYFQAGGRFTASAGPSDFGIQYYYGRLPRPAYAITPPSPPIIPASIEQFYNPYHHIGVDYARVIAGFNVRAEAAANITEDLKGDDGSVYNPHLAWSLGFDRDLFLGVNLNLQCNESIRLMHDRLDGPLDTEAGKDLSATMITAVLSKKFFRDELELKTTAIWEVEAKDFLVMPAIIWTRDALTTELSFGVFGGDRNGQFGQFRDNGFVKAALSYSF